MSFPSDLPPAPPGFVSVQASAAAAGTHVPGTAHWVCTGGGSGPMSSTVAGAAHNLTFVHDSPAIEVTPDEARRYKEEILQGLQVSQVQ
jgi:hypothetical protein